MNDKLLALGTLSLIAMPFANAAAQQQASVKHPNIIYILADDLGYGDIGICGQQIIPTPNLDKMARDGMIFNHHYAGAPVSAPSRCILMTGKHSGHSSIRGNKSIAAVGTAPLHPEDITLPEAIKNKTNYVTGMCGRWHLGGELSNQTPYHRGFDYHFGKLGSDFRNRHGVMIDSLWDQNGKHIPYSKYSQKGLEPMYNNGNYYNLTPEEMKQRPINMDRMVTDKAMQFIENNSDRPFFLYVAYSLMHAPMEYHENMPVEANDWPDTERAFASMMMSLDKYVGDILDQVDKLGLSEKTLIIFTSDNGAHNEGGHDHTFFRSTGDFKGFKRDLYEGGTHTPMFARWTGTIPAGSQTDLLSAFWDIMPTICDLAGAPIPSCTDGISFAPTLRGKRQIEKHEYLYWEFNERSSRVKPGKEYKQAVVFDDWKVVNYIDEDRIEVYNLTNDPEENHDLSEQHPELISKALKYMKESHIQNPIFPLTKEERNIGHK